MHSRLSLQSLSSLILLATSLPSTLSQYLTCPPSIAVEPLYGKPEIADGWTIQLVANGLGSPRSIVFDRIGRLLLLNSGGGVMSIAVNNTNEDNTGCWYLGDMKHIIKDSSLNHGLALAPDGRTILTSSSSDLKSWTYNHIRIAVGFPQTVVSDMDQSGHSTRTLLIPRHNEDLVLVSRGSAGNIDKEAADLSSGHSQLKSFRWKSGESNYGQMFNDDGTILGWGLRNSVGLAEDSRGNIWSVENSADNIERYGEDFHEDNPAEELNFHGNPSEKPKTPPNFGYPSCLATWEPKDVPQLPGIKTGQQFANDPTGSVSDSDCKDEKKYTRPRLAFQAHMAPLDIEFYNPNTTNGEFNCTFGLGCENVGNAFISFHGSWNRKAPVGYKLSMIEFGEDGQPKEKQDSMNATKDIVWNKDNSKCPDECFRPVGLAFDMYGNLWMTSDSTGELYVISRSNKPNTTENGTVITTAPGKGQNGAGSSLKANLALAFTAFAAFFLL